MLISNQDIASAFIQIKVVATPQCFPAIFKKRNNFRDYPFASLDNEPGRVAQSVGHLTRKSEVLGSTPGLATYFRFSFRFFKKDSCQLLAKVCARSTG